MVDSVRSSSSGRASSTGHSYASGLTSFAARSSASDLPTREYEDLEGAEGREVFFRAPRYRSEQFGPVSAQVMLTDATGVDHDCELRDASTGGVAVQAPTMLDAHQGGLIARLVVTFGGYAAYDGRAEIASVRGLGAERVVGLSLLDSPMNLDDVLQLRDVRLWGEQSTTAAAPASWQVQGYADLKAVIADQRLLLEDAKFRYTKMEQELPWQLLHGEAPSLARQQLIDRIRSEFVAPWLTSIYAADQAMRDAGLAGENPGDATLRLKEMSQRHLQSFFAEGPIIHRAWTKPLGYPGDYGVMRHVYEQPFEGQTLFAKAMHLAGWSMACTQGVRNRNDIMRQRLADAWQAAAKDGRTLRVVSVAAGPAQELFELLRDVDIPGGHLQILLFEQDREALAYAQSRILRVADPRVRPHIRLSFLQDSIRRLLRDPELFSRYGPFDLILCAGLFDYLPEPTAVRLARQLYANLADGGEVWIGNLVPWNPCRWMLEWHLDWKMIHRSHQDMLRIGELAAPDATLRIVDEPARVNPFVVLHRD